MTADTPLLILVHADDEHEAISRAETSAHEDYHTVTVLDCHQGSGGVWTVRLTVSDRKRGDDIPPSRPEPQLDVTKTAAQRPVDADT